MANSTAQLTDTQIKKARSQAKEYNLADGRGLQLRIKPSAAKVWLFNYKKPGSGKRTNIKLGEYPDMPIAKARQLRGNYRSLLSDGIDPQVHLREIRVKENVANENTLRAVADKWFEIKSHEISERYARDIYNSLDRHVFPKLGNRPIHELRAKEVIDVLELLQKQNKLELIRRICQRLNMIMDFAVIRDIMEANRLTPISKAFKTPIKEHLPTIKPDELPLLMSRIRLASIKPVTNYLIQWQLHTMVRAGEACRARWDEIDFEKKVWLIPGAKMKKKRDHHVPLSTHAISILRELRPISGNRDYIFPSDRNPRAHANSATVNMALRRMGFKGTLVSHGLRSLASTTLNEKNFNVDLIESALSHVDKNSVRGAYNRTDYLHQRRPLMQWWSEHIEHAASGDQKPRRGKKNLLLFSKSLVR